MQAPRWLAVLVVATSCGGAGKEIAAPPDAPTGSAVPDAAQLAGCRNGTLDPGEECDDDPQCGRSAHCTPACTCAALDPAPPATSQVLIDAAYRAGQIDLGESLLLRAYALYRDPRLPEKYDGVGAELEDLTLHHEMRQALATLSPAAQAALHPFLVRPSAPDSIFSTGYAAGASLRPGDGSCPAAASCAAWQSADTAHFRVWSCGEDDTDGTRADTAADAESVYPAMSAYLGEPVPDEEDNAGGVAKIDIYIVQPNETRSRGGACVTLSDTMGGGTLSAPSELVAGGSGELITSGYILLPIARAGSSDRKSTIVHEFFHVLELAHSYGAMSSWLAESSAVWAERHFLPDDENVRISVYSYFPKHTPDVVGSGFLSRVSEPLDTNVTGLGLNASYEAFIWHYFAEQETSASVVAQVWTKIANGGYAGPKYNGAVNAVFPFANHFGAFILRNLNRDAVKDAGQKLYKDLDRRFPDANEIPALETKDKLEAGGTLSESVSIKHLAASYVHLTVDDSVHELTFDFSDLSGGANVDLELLLSKSPEGVGGWSAKELKGERKLTLCRDQGDDPVFEAYIAVGNHDWQGESTVTGTYKVTGKAVCCPAGQTCWSGNIHATSSFPGLGSTDTTDAEVTFMYSSTLYVYVPTSGSFTGKRDIVTAECESHFTGSAAIGSQDGSIILTDAGQYVFQGASPIDLSGTVTCGGPPESETLNDTLKWWPSSLAGVLFMIKPNGRIEDSMEFTNEESGEVVTADWSLSP